MPDAPERIAELQQQLAASQLREHRLRCVSDRIQRNLKDAAALYPEHFYGDGIRQLLAEWDAAVRAVDISDLSSYVAECVRAAGTGEQPQETQGREQRVAEWVITRIGAAHMQSRERTMRGLEEAIEWAQAEGITSDQVLQQVAHVFARPPGDPKQEAAGVAVCLLAWCAANHTTFAEMADQEIARIEAKPIGQIRGSVARKTDADLVVVVEKPQEPENLGQVKQ